ncbi:MAG TPA: hypothetical protein VNM15_04015 [Candidatus Binatia bacterium]|nr:hypothetical protein [Candidatus Binatia bacterium]
MNSTTKALVFAFRKPRFPLICDLDGDLFAAEFFPRTWRKIEIINLFNRSRVAKERGLYYPERSLGNRRLDMIVREIAALLKKQTGRRHG